jgi:hypothetical protein
VMVEAAKNNLQFSKLEGKTQFRYIISKRLETNPLEITATRKQFPSRLQI